MMELHQQLCRMSVPYLQVLFVFSEVPYQNIFKSENKSNLVVVWSSTWVTKTGEFQVLKPSSLH